MFRIADFLRFDDECNQTDRPLARGGFYEHADELRLMQDYIYSPQNSTRLVKASSLWFRTPALPLCGSIGYEKGLFSYRF